MSLLMQILSGTLCLALCSLAHVMVLAISLPNLTALGKSLSQRSAYVRMVVLLLAMLAAIIVSHGAQIWFWALFWYVTEAVGDLNTAVYFSTVTYTTLGYGDVVLSPDFRIFATFSSVAGLLTFGISTAFLVGLLGHMFKEEFRD